MGPGFTDFSAGKVMWLSPNLVRLINILHQILPRVLYLYFFVFEKKDMYSKVWDLKSPPSAKISLPCRRSELRRRYSYHPFFSKQKNCIRSKKPLSLEVTAINQFCPTHRQTKRRRWPSTCRRSVCYLQPFLLTKGSMWLVQRRWSNWSWRFCNSWSRCLCWVGISRRRMYDFV